MTGKAQPVGRVGAIRSNVAAAQNAADYANQTRRPIVCLAFVLPLLFLYEIGSIFSTRLAGKSGVDQWLHQALDSLGFGHLVILPLVTAGVLLHWHHRTGDDWRIRPGVMLGMLAESSCLGIILFFAGNAVTHLVASGGNLPSLAIGGTDSQAWWDSTIAFIGCGVYEELIFRLLLLSGLIQFGKKYWQNREAKIAGIVITSLLFAALHYDFLNSAGATFDFSGFLFRFLASVVFCILFLFRGFGIAVGTHAIYDVMTQI